ncbi:hypothetical protein BVC80_6205g3 [Macleaya cordata]|uniref:Uncharacterized protein n=1 Tax=Macleaya cordata TaxID=56857 RepID=A0A200R0R3_MACCD|nr:hypothetical protein BVC80_6205g3 [Macleaya cordata]
MIKAGKLLSASPVTTTGNEKPETESRMLKFGDLQVELTPTKANIGAAIAFGFGILSWELSQGIQSIPESSLQYANDNALVLAKSLRGALLVLCYSSTVLSGFATIGLILLGRQLQSKDQGAGSWFKVPEFFLDVLAVFAQCHCSDPRNADGAILVSAINEVSVLPLSVVN